MSYEPIEVIMPGSTVEFTHSGDGVTGVVTGVQVSMDLRLLYRVTWWEARTKKEEWVFPAEIREYYGKEPLVIGFALPGGQRLQPPENERRPQPPSPPPLKPISIGY